MHARSVLLNRPFSVFDASQTESLKRLPKSLWAFFEAAWRETNIVKAGGNSGLSFNRPNVFSTSL